MKTALLFAAICASLELLAEPFGAVKEIVGRVAGDPSVMDRFVFEKMDGEGEKATVGPDSEGRRILIRATCESAASFALGRYMRDVQKSHVSWCGNRIPEEWPVPEKTFSVAPAVPVRFAYNYCTLSYTMAFWSKKEWRDELDRLALHGFNAALLVAGLPEVWRETIGKEAAEGFISDEAASAWWHMGNLQGLGGPLPDERIKADAELGRWLYAEMKKLGIEPCIQSFTGLIPDGYEGLPDGTAVFEQGKWQGYARPDILSPKSKAFDELAEKWYRALAKVYRPDLNGYTRYMAGDLFHEGGRKGDLTDADLADAARKIQATQAEHFGNGGSNTVTWVLQSWQGSPCQGIRDGLDPNRSLILFLDKDMSRTGPVAADYVNRTTDEHIPWIWAEVMNFGGNTGLYGGARRFGSLAKTGSDPAHAASFRGYGMLSEGLETNAIMYDLFTDGFSSSHEGPVFSENREAWIGDFVLRRYGMRNARLQTAVRTLLATVWDCSRYQEGCVENIMCAVPGRDVKSVSKWGPKTGTPYRTESVRFAMHCYESALEGNPSLADEETFMFDRCELQLQILADSARQLNDDAVKPGAARDEFMFLFDKAESFLSGCERWTLDWHLARTVATAGEAGRRGYRRMVTTWTGDFATGRSSGLRDYAHRAYSGLLDKYYRKRWEWYFELCDGKISEGEYESRLKRLDDAVLDGSAFEKHE
ncbi:MAG: alpha-N-acetylglucosaminidase [Kiritimatiellae bacterium]|nr:alpha-N-acetylglucosaminidase [Kiritimatiellia bacterium]